MQSLAPPALDRDAIVRKLCQELRNGSTRAAAYRCAGIAEPTFYHWMSNHEEVLEAVTRAEAEARAAVEQKFHTDAVEGQDWRARSDWLKRRYRDDWGDKLDLTGLPDHLVLELLGGNKGQQTSATYPSAPMKLLTKRTSDSTDEATPADVHPLASEPVADAVEEPLEVDDIT